VNYPRADLPFFAYGLFKPGQLGFLRLRELVEQSEPDCALRGTLLERDGLPIVDEDGMGTVRGSLIFFHRRTLIEAYLRIIEIEPDKHYRWGIGRVETRRGIREANVLFGKSPRRGSDALGQSDWDGKRDPLFTSALEVVQEVANQNVEFEWNLKPLFRLQMAYLLLWSAIERYVSLRYHLGGDVYSKVKRLAKEEAFIVSLREQAPGRRVLYRTDKPGEREVLDVSNPDKSLGYYYQVRSNITHRGKAVIPFRFVDGIIGICQRYTTHR
jgi:hypothetical protein